MNKHSFLSQITIALITFASATQAAVVPVVLDQGHNPIEVLYENESWTFFIDGSETGGGHHAPNEATYHLTNATQLTIPSNPNFTFLGAPGDPVWIAPHIESPGVLLLGVSGEGIASNTFQNDRLNLQLKKIDGPGSFSVYAIDSAGEIDLLQDSSDGIDAQDAIPFGIGGHDHQNWAFTAPGIYELTFQASGRLTDGTFVESEESTFQFAVGNVDPLPSCEPIPVDVGDADIAVAYEEQQLKLEVFWGAQELTLDADEAYYLVKPNSRITVQPDPAFAFLGSPGDTAWVAPQADEEGKLFLALAGDNLPTGVFVDERVHVAMKIFQGPGNFSAYETNAFGSPSVYFDTSDGISDSDNRDVIVGEHYHMNWGFSAPGNYTVEFQASARLAATGEELVSELTTFQFRVTETQPLAGVLTATRVDTDTLSLEWFGQESIEYQLQSRHSIDTQEWQNVGLPILGANEDHSINVSIEPTLPSQFYRITTTEVR